MNDKTKIRKLKKALNDLNHRVFMDVLLPLSEEEIKDNYSELKKNSLKADKILISLDEKRLTF